MMRPGTHLMPSCPIGPVQDLEPKFHVEYKVVVTQGPRSWTVLRRYQVTYTQPCCTIAKPVPHSHVDIASESDDTRQSTADYR